DAAHGVVKTWYQVLPGDFHDWDVGAAPALITTSAGKHLVSIAGKDGHLYGYERDSRARVYATEVTTVENATAPFTPGGTHFCPGIQGGVEWNGPSFSAKTNLLYVNSIDWCSTVKIVPASKLEGRRGLPWTGSAELTKPFGAFDKTSKGWLTAVDAEDGKVKWRYASSTPLVAAVTSTAGGLVFTGDLKGSVFAFNAETGAELWRHEVGQPIGGGVITYAVNGKQYVAVAVGMHSPKAWLVEGGQARVVVFGLP
ncbi:MAG: PQQ-binding-like beta-propeller repeat protein, partial [Gemmatimonadota bacterium]|nr:PQQ-binding-like beta-propeller repeat protein [Gemmatimonadota bacterium]